VTGLRQRVDLRGVLLTLAAPVAALVIAVAFSSIALLISSIDPLLAYQRMWEYGTDVNSIVDILNRSSYYYIAAVAVAVGFRMNLFNIGVDGQYQIAAMVAAAAGGGVFLRDLPGPLLTLVVVLIAVAVGAIWAGIAGLLKVTRGVSEVISTIMLNAIGAGLGSPDSDRRRDRRLPDQRARGRGPPARRQHHHHPVAA